MLPSTAPLRMWLDVAAKHLTEPLCVPERSSQDFFSF